MFTDFIYEILGNNSHCKTLLKVINFGKLLYAFAKCYVVRSMTDLRFKSSPNVIRDERALI